MISVLLVSIVILGCTQYLNNLSESYSTTVDLTDLDNTEKSMNRMINVSQEMNKEIQNMTLSTGGITNFIYIPYQMIKTGWNVLKLIFSSWDTTLSMIKDSGTGLQNTLSLPSFILPIITSIIVIMIVAIIVYAWFKWKFES